MPRKVTFTQITNPWEKLLARLLWSFSSYRGHFPDIAVVTAKFLISRYCDNRDLSVCLAGFIKYLEIPIKPKADKDDNSTYC